MKYGKKHKKGERKANKYQNREGCYDAFWKVQGKGERRKGGNINMEELKGIFLIVPRIGAAHWVKNEILGGDR